MLTALRIFMVLLLLYGLTSVACGLVMSAVRKVGGDKTFPAGHKIHKDRRGLIVGGIVCIAVSLGVLIYYNN